MVRLLEVVVSTLHRRQVWQTSVRSLPIVRLGLKRDTSTGVLHTFKGEENKESKLILLLFGIVDLREETEMIIRFQRVIIISHHIREGITDIPRSDDDPRFSRLPREQEKGEDDASYEDPFSDCKWYFDAVAVVCFG